MYIYLKKLKKKDMIKGASIVNMNVSLYSWYKLVMSFTETQVQIVQLKSSNSQFNSTVKRFLIKMI